MILIIYSAFLLITLVSITWSAKLYYKHDERSIKEINRFTRQKGCAYLIYAALTFIFAFFAKDTFNLLVIFSICLSLNDGILTIAEGKSNDFDLQAKKALENAKQNTTDLKQVERLDEFCRIEIDKLTDRSSSSERKLRYEVILEYVKYYEEADLFIKTFNDYVNGKAVKEDVVTAEENFFEDMKYSVIEIVKLPNE